MPVAASVASFDVFLSYSRTDAAAVERIAERLARAGLAPWLDRWCLTPGGRWQDELAQGLAASAACAVFIGASDVGDWGREELAVALDRAAKQRGFRLFLVLLPGLPEPFEAGGLTPFLSTRTWVDFRRGVDDTRALQALVNAVKGVPLGPEVPIQPRDDVCPYRGLQGFDEQHAEFFFGREADVQRLVEKLKAEPFLAVVGPSGSGKSSLARAGLIPALRRGAVAGSESWDVVALRPGAHPLDALTGHVLAAYPDLAAGAVRDQLAADPRTLRLLTARPPRGGARPLFLVDQCEEVFTLCRSEDERRLFLLNVLHAAAADGPSVVLITLRADFYPRCAAYPALAQHMAGHQFLVGAMSEEGLRQAIEEPARLVGLEPEAGLIDTILDDVRHQPGALPLLEHALLELWQRRRGGMLTLEAYQESGGVTGALAKRADATLATFAPEQRAIVRRVLLRLTQPGEGSEDTRRRAAMSELVTLPAAADAIQGVVRSLADARLLTTGGNEVEVAHEALIRGWPQLRRWVEEDRQGLRTHRRLTDAAEQWRALGDDPGALYRGARLAATRDWAADHEPDLNELEREFLAASVAAEVAETVAARRRTQRLRVLAASLAVLLAVAVVLGLIALRSRGQARQQAKIASSGALAGQAIIQMDRRLDLGMLLALQGYQKSPTVEARNAVALALQRADGLASVASAGDSQIAALAVSPDRRTMAIAGGDQRATVITLWNIDPWRQLGKPLRGHTDDVLRLAFSPDGGTLASASEEEKVRLWEVPSGRPKGKPMDSGHDVGLAFDRQGATLATSAPATSPPFGGIVVRDVATGARIAAGAGDTAPDALALSPDGELLASAGSDEPIRLWRVKGSRVVSDPACPSSRDATGGFGLAFADDGRTLAWAAEGGTVGLFDVRRCAIIARRRSAHRAALAVSFMPRGHRLASAGVLGVRLWNVPGLDPATRRLGSTAVAGLDWTGDASLASAGAPGGAVRIWDLSGRSTLARPLAVDRPTLLALSPDGRTLAVAGDGDVTLWDTRRRTRLGDLVDAPEARALAFAPDGLRLAIGDIDGRLGLWDVSTLRPVIRNVRAADIIRDVAFAPDGGTLASVGWPSEAIRRFRARDLTPMGRRFVAATSWALWFAFAPDGRLLVCDEDGTIEVWDAAKPKRVGGFLSGCGQPGSLAVSPDGRTLAAGGTDVIALWDLRSRRPLGQRLVGHTGDITSLSFSADGRTLASAAGDLRLWDVSRRRQIGDAVPGYDFVAFTRDGLLSSGRAGTVVWEPLLFSESLETVRRRICSVVGRNLSPLEQREFLPDGSYEPTC